MRTTVVISVMVMVLLAGPARAQEIPLEQIQSAIARGVEEILATQAEDGSFVISPRHQEAYPRGATAVAVMALQYARPHLKGDLRARAFEAIRKGLAYITQRGAEAKTYSAGFVVAALFMENPERYRKWINGYARMLVAGQRRKRGEEIYGEWGYLLPPETGLGGIPSWQASASWADKSNTQIALLGLYYAHRAGYQVPRSTWERAREHYLKAQFPDGGWGYNPGKRPKPYANMTIASTISLNLCNEMLLKREVQCKAPPRSKAVEMGLKWIAENWSKPIGVSGTIGSDTYGLYALERLGIIMGRANIGGHDWFNEGARQLIRSRSWRSYGGTSQVSACFGVMFLARGLEPIIINKLERRDTDDWNNTPYDVKHLVEYIQDHYQLPVQWRIVSLEAPLELLLRTPILHVSGHEALDFNEQEKQKLKAYVDGGGTILGQACCSMKAFDESFRQFVTEVFGGKLQPVAKTHRIYERMRIRGMAPKPELEVLAADNQQGRPVIIFLPHGIARPWHLGGSRAREAYAVGTGIYFYVTIEGRKMYERSHPDAVRSAP